MKSLPNDEEWRKNIQDARASDLNIRFSSRMHYRVVGGGGRGGERRVKGWSKNASETKTSRFLKVSGSIGLQTGAAIIIIHFPGRVPICIWHAGKNNALNAPLLWSARPSTPSPGSQSIAKKITQLSLLTLSFKRFHAFFFPVGISFTQFHKRVPILLGFLGFYSD